jgi:hypothetical protein
MFNTYCKKIISFTLLFFTLNAHAQDTLVFAFDIIRHGDRTPLSTIPKAPHTWLEGMGQLTAIGMQQEHQRGIGFRKKYQDQYHLLPTHFQNDTIYIFSTNTDRTLMSAESALLGLYPLGTGPFLSSNKPALPNAYQPIPIHTKSLNSEPFVEDSHSEKYNKLFNQTVASQPAWIQKTKELQNKFPAWSQATGLTLSDIRQLELLADTLHIYQLHHVSPPAELSDKDVKDIIAVGIWGYTTEYKTKEIATVVGTPLLATIADYLQQAVQQKTPLKYVLFSAHDSTILSVMTMLGAPLNEQPPYASNVNFSLFKTDQGNTIVKVNYNEKPVFIPSCGSTSCTLQQFTQDHRL